MILESLVQLPPRSRRVRGVLSLLAILASGAAPARAQVDSTWRDHDRALQAARAAHDTASYRAQLSEIYHALGSTPRIASRFAALALEARDGACAKRWLGAIAVMGAALDSGLLVQYVKLGGPAAAAEIVTARNRAVREIGAPQLVSRLPDPDMISEDIAFDGARSRFLVSSVRRGSIFSMNTNAGTAAKPVFTPDQSWGILALGVDSARGTLWATTAALSMGARYAAADSGRSALMELDLQTGTLLGRYEAPDSGAHALGDLTIGSRGEVYVSDGLGSGVYALDAGHASLHVLVPRGVLVSPQMPVLSSDETTLFVPDYAIGIAVVDIASGERSWLSHSDSLALTGVDGMYRIGHDIIIVQNGLEPNRIVRLTLDARMHRVVRATTLVQGGLARELTHAARSHDWLYFIARSGWDRVADDGTMRAATSSEGPVIARVRIAP